MSRHPRRTSEVIVARSKRTGQKYATRTSCLAGHNGNRGPFLHYTDSTRLETCRCDTVNSHQKPYPVSDDDTNLAVAITRYMDKFDLESCHQPDFHRYRERQKIDWALRSVHAERFHYVSREKTVVCRCNSLDHLSCRRVHNPKIQELCANFFLLESAAIMCTREQWRESEGGTTTPTKSTPSRKDSLEPERNQYSPNRSLFEYDNPSVVRLLQIREARSLESRKHRSYRATSYLSPPGEDMAHLSNGPNGEPDVPEFVWRVSRPSVYLGQNQYEESLLSTPIGTAATPVEQKNLNLDPMSLKGRPSTLAAGATAPGVDQYFGTDSNVLGSQCVYKNSERLNCRTESVRVGDRCDSAVDFAGPQVSLAETSQPSTPGSPETISHLVELPSLERAIELESSCMSSSNSSHFSRSLSEEGLVGAKHAVELNGRTSTTPSRTSKRNVPSHRLTQLIEQPLGDSRLPSQEDFFLQWVEVCSRARPAPLGDCSLCNNSLDAPNKSTIHLPCGHYVHHECLVSQFRVQDLEYGNCPVCGMALCERTLHDRIDTDRGAIFGQSFANLQVEERIEFARRGEIVSCWSEEEVAAALLRLLKDYIDVHADDLYIQWQETGCEPDWHNTVVTPVVQLFKGWSVPNRTRNCSYFADRDAFYKLVVWAELVRLMNTIREALRTLQGVNAPFPQLSELHRKFMLAKERYEKEKKTWPTNRSGVLMCEKVAQDAFSLAVGTHLGSRL